MGDDSFGPLTNPVPKRQGASTKPVPIVPVPADAPPPLAKHHSCGQATHVWTYTDAKGATIGHVARFETAAGKQILPQSFCRLPNGTTGWRWQSFPKPRPLFNLLQLSDRMKAPILVVEGEKAACAAQMIFSDCVVITWPGGAQARDTVDWTPLAGRHVVLWPDADEPGRIAMESVAAMVSSTAASVRVVRLPDGLPPGWDLADKVPDGLDVSALLADAEVVVAQTFPQAGYRVSELGLFWRDPKDPESGDRRIAGPFTVAAQTHGSDGGDWGLLLSWLDSSGRHHEKILPRAALAGDGIDARRLLLDGGLYVSQAKRDRDRLTDFLLNVYPPKLVRVVNRIGWHEDTFVLPDRSIGQTTGTAYKVGGIGDGDHAFRASGTLTDWKNEIAGYAVGNSRLAFVISAALAGPLLKLCGGESGGFQLMGPSSLGKTTALMVAGSVHGGGEVTGYIKSWRSTTNGLEALAAAHSDTLLCLDELGQVQPEDAAEAAYMLANGSGKARAKKDGSARQKAEWRLLFLSSGEIGLADKIAEIRGRRRTAGQGVRLVDIQADAGQGLGMFESLHGFPSADAFATHLRSATATVYGTAGPAFIEALVGTRGAIAERVKAQIDAFVATVPSHADGQILRVARRVALVAAAGELGISLGILPWPPDEASLAARRLFDEWIAARGGHDGAEVSDAIERLRDFITAHGSTRFQSAWSRGEVFRPPHQGLAGYRKRAGDGWEYFLLPGTWNQILQGLNTTSVADALIRRRLLLPPGAGRHRSKSISIPGTGKQRVYHLDPEIIQDDPD